ncbi:unnamed protein product, partial [Rotaria socialis]
MSIRDDNDSHLEVSEEGEVAEMTLVEHLVSKIWKSWDRITNVYLIATGGDYIEGSYYRQACVALYSNEICLNQFTNNEKILYIYIQLKHRVITLNP